MRTHASPSWPQARDTAFCALPLPGVEIPAATADGRTLAAPVIAATDLPGFDTSSMDGWAVNGTGPWQLHTGQILAGQAPQLELEPGWAIEIATGAATPVGTSAVLRSEYGQVNLRRLQATKPLAEHADFRPRGEECRQGDVLLDAEVILTPAAIGLITAAGVDQVLVRARPRVAIVLLGDELVFAGTAGIGQVRDALGPQLPPWLQRLGADTVSISRAADTLSGHIEAIQLARQNADVVITTGGTAAGPVDHVHQVVTQLGGRFLIDSVAVRPGHPMALADLNPATETLIASETAKGGELSPAARWLLALPGNPQSAIVALFSLGAPLLASLVGQQRPALVQVIITESATAPEHEHRLVACTREGQQVTPVQHLGSAMLRGLAAAQGFAVIPPGGTEAGSQVAWLALPV